MIQWVATDFILTALFVVVAADLAVSLSCRRRLAGVEREMQTARRVRQARAASRLTVTNPGEMQEPEMNKKQPRGVHTHPHVPMADPNHPDRPFFG